MGRIGQLNNYIQHIVADAPNADVKCYEGIENAPTKDLKCVAKMNLNLLAPMKIKLISTDPRGFFEIAVFIG